MERQTDRQRAEERQTDRQTQTERERKRDRQTDRQRQRDRERERMLRIFCAVVWNVVQMLNANKSILDVQSNRPQYIHTMRISNAIITPTHNIW